MTHHKQKEIEELIRKASSASKSEDAMRFSQAACNAANALVSMQAVRPIPSKEQIDA